MSTYRRIKRDEYERLNVTLCQLRHDNASLMARLAESKAEIERYRASLASMAHILERELSCTRGRYVG